MKYIITLLVIVALFIFGVTVYLQPNDFLSCRESPVVGTSCEKADAIVVVSGGNTSARTEAGVRMLQDGWADTIIFSGAAQDKTGPSNAAEMKRLALEGGVDESKILLDEEAETTQQNAEKLKLIIEQQNIGSIILVTSGYHQRRASLEFHKRAGDISIRNAPVHDDGDWSWYWWLTPRGWWLAGGELAKIGAFYIGGIE